MTDPGPPTEGGPTVYTHRREVPVMIDDLDWMADAACRGLPLEMFYPLPGDEQGVARRSGGLCGLPRPGPVPGVGVRHRRLRRRAGRHHGRRAGGPAPGGAAAPDRLTGRLRVASVTSP